MTEEIGDAKGERETRLLHRSSYYTSSLIIRDGSSGALQSPAAHDNGLGSRCSALSLPRQF
jgi:hypothetical protein